jgi:hypothetical protein
MNNSLEQYQKHLKRQSEATVASASDLTKHIQAIATAHADYAKRSFKEGAAFFERLASAKSFEEAVEVRTEYTKTAHDTFAAESKRIVETYTELFRNALKPFGSMIAETPSRATVK